MESEFDLGELERIEEWARQVTSEGKELRKTWRGMLFHQVSTRELAGLVEIIDSKIKALDEEREKVWILKNAIADHKKDMYDRWEDDEVKIDVESSCADKKLWKHIDSK